MSSVICTDGITKTFDRRWPAAVVWGIVVADAPLVDAAGSKQAGMCRPFLVNLPIRALGIQAFLLPFV